MKKYEEFEHDLEFRKYLREQKLTLKEYFLSVYDKRDPYNGEPIPYKDKKQYLSQRFVTKGNLNKWITQNPKEGADYIVEKLEERKSDGKLQWALSEVETRSLSDFPTLSNLLAAGIDWKGINEAQGLNVKYNYGLTKFNKSKEHSFLIDTREQKPLKLKSSKVQKLAYGDYTVVDSSSVFIERKSIQDLWGTMSSGYDRFCREVDRADKDGAYLVVVVDYPIYKAISYNHNRRFSKASPEFIFKRIRELCQSYNNVQFVFSGDRDKSCTLFNWIFSNSDNVKNVDIQYLLSTKNLKL